MQPTPDQSPDSEVSSTEIAYSEEAVLQGVIYPPPPSFYQNMGKATPQQPPLPSVASSPHLQSSYTAAMQTGVKTPLPSAPPASTKLLSKHTPTWVWILIAFLALLTIGGCALFSWSTTALFHEENQQVADATSVVTAYYTAIREQQYTRATTYLASQESTSNLAVNTFTRQAQASDAQYGAIQSFTLSSTPTYNTTQIGQTNTIQMIFTVNVKRARKSYTAFVTVQQIAGNWKITQSTKI